MLHEAQDERTPLLERLKFLAIFTSNLDEFYMKRVGLLSGMVKADIEGDPVAHGGNSAERLAKIRQSVLKLLADQARCYSDVLVPELRRSAR